MVKIGREEPIASMDNSGKVIWAKHNEIHTVNIKSVGTDEVCSSYLGPEIILKVEFLTSLGGKSPCINFCTFRLQMEKDCLWL